MMDRSDWVGGETPGWELHVDSGALLVLGGDLFISYLRFVFIILTYHD